MARRIHDGNASQRSYARVTGSDHDRELEALHKKIDDLVKIVNEKDQRISQLETTLQGQNNDLTSQRTTAQPAVSFELKNLLNAQDEKFRRMIKSLMETNLQLQREVKELRAAVHPAGATSSLSEEEDIRYEEAVTKTEDEKVITTAKSTAPTFPTTQQAHIEIANTTLRTSPQDATSDSSESSPTPDNSPNPGKLGGTPRPTRDSLAARSKNSGTTTPSPASGNQTPKRSANDMSNSDLRAKQFTKKQKEGAHSSTIQKLRR